MNRLNVEELKRDKVEINIEDIDEGIRLKFNGDIDMQDPGPLLNPFFDKVHNALVENEVKEVEADFRELQFLNSSGIKTLIKWIMKIPQLPDEKKYKVKIIYSGKITWQGTSLKTLIYLAPGYATAEKVV